MGRNVLKSVLLPVAIILAGFPAVFGLSGYVSRVRPPLPESYEDNDLSLSGAKLKGFALGFESLMADWYWMQSLQYIGGKMVKNASEDLNMDDLRSLNPGLLYPYLDTATDLDPHFIAPYSYGAVVLPAIDPEKAIAIAKKGIANNPNEWRLYQQLGYIYWKLGQYETAAESYDNGSKVPGAAPFMALMAASMKTEGGSRATARQIFRQMLDGSDDPAVRITAERRLKGLDSLDEREAIDKVLDEFKTNTGRCAGNLGEIMPMLLNVKLPDGHEFRVDGANRLVDPTDAPYALDKNNCRVQLDAEHTGLPLK